MTTITGITENEDEQNIIEIASDKPKIAALRAEIQKGLIDLDPYRTACDRAYDYWHAEWPGQTLDGRKHGAERGAAPFPWEGSSDTRVRMGEKFVRQHVAVSKAAFTNARVQATALRPAVNGREAAQGTQLLKFIVSSHMQPQLQSVVPLVQNWRWAYGASATAIEWEQEERIEEKPISLPIIDDYLSAQGAPPAMDYLVSTVRDPAQEESWLQLLLQMSDMLTRREARSILADLRTIGTSEIPVRFTFKSQPRWTALKIGVDLIFPSETCDIQRARWIARREFVSRGELLSRIRTQDYDPKFVEELLKHKGQSAQAGWIGRTLAERGYYGSGYGSRLGYDNSFTQMYELLHMTYKASDQGTPRMFKTTFNPSAIGHDAKHPLYAAHAPFDYAHGLYPVVIHRAEWNDAPIMTSRGIPEIVATWEDEVKVQRDGRTDMTALELGPPLIVSRPRAGTVQNYPLPRATLVTDKPNDFQFMPTPPLGQRSIEIERTVLMTAAEFIGLFDAPGEALMDPDWKNLRRQEVAADTLGEYVQVMDQTFMILQQFMTDSEVQAVVGPHSLPFPIDPRTIQQKHQISATFDSRMLDADWVKEKMELVQMAVQIGAQSGRIDESALPEVLLNIADPSLADMLLRPADVAADQERKDELQAIGNAFNGLETPPPMHGNHQLRLQTIMQNTVQSQNPEMAKRLRDNPDTVEILKKRAEFYQNQLQQTQQNPVIGRTLATAPFAPKEALPTVASGQ